MQFEVYGAPIYCVVLCYVHGLLGGFIVTHRALKIVDVIVDWRFWIIPDLLLLLMFVVTTIHLKKEKKKKLKFFYLLN